MANLYAIGQSALAAAQAGVSTAGQNIANVSTPGYSRQSVVQAAAQPQLEVGGYMGQGTEVVEIQRAYNSFLGAQVLTTQSAKSQLEQHYAQIQPIDNLLADNAAGLAPAMQDFFDSMQGVAQSPSDAAPRQQLLASADAMLARLHALGKSLEDIAHGLDGQIEASVNNINQAAQRLLDVNQAINRAQGAANQPPPSDLLDQRDQILRDLSREVQVAVSDKEGRFEVTIGNGLPLVSGSKAQVLQVHASSSTNGGVAVNYAPDGGSAVVVSPRHLSGGVLGGLLDFQALTLPMARQGLDVVAATLADGINVQHKAGFTQSGAQGGNFFDVPVAAIPDPANASGATLTVELGMLSKLQAGDYALRQGAAGYELVDASDQSVIHTASSMDDMNAFTADLGFTLQSNLQSGDSFAFQIPAHLAGALSLGVKSEADIAAASASTAQSGDNGNILKMADLQFSRNGPSGADSALGEYANLVGRVGSKTRELQLTSASAGQIHTQAQTALQNASGVNLDEEAANLIRYQQSYQAAAKIIQLVQQMFDTVLQMDR